MSRPYRSHKVPACDFCRQRKARCTIEAAGQSCLVCRLNGKSCSRAGLPPAVERSIHQGQGRETTTKRKSRAQRLQNLTHSSIRPGSSDLERDVSVSASTEPLPSIEERREAGIEQSTHIVGPVVARDARILAEQYSQPSTSGHLFKARLRPSPYNIYSDDPNQPVLYLNVPKGRVGLSQKAPLTFRQTEILEKLVEPHKMALLELYAEKFHPYFPLFDDDYLKSEAGLQRLPEVVIADLFACSLIFWKCSPVLRVQTRPDINYIWNLAVAALNEHFLAPDLSTVLAAALDLMGRPVYSITGNALNIGRTVALCHSLGLNRDPSNWQIPDSEKRLRMRMWWAILIHDWWASIAHGTPPHIQSQQYDVTVPDITVLLPPGSSQPRIRAATCFIALCQLTEIIGYALPLIYTLKPDQLSHITSLQNIERKLENWVYNLPEYIEMKDFNRKTPGLDLRSLQLSFLSVKVLLCRLKLHDIGSTGAAAKNRLYYQDQCQSAANDITEFVENLNESDFEEFWLPYSAYHFTSATTLLLRCAIEAKDAATAQACIDSANRLVTCLKRAKTRFSWDIGDICLIQCESIAKKMKAGDFRRLSVQHDPSGLQTSSLSTSSDPLFSNEMFSFAEEMQFPDIWDIINFDASSYS